MIECTPTIPTLNASLFCFSFSIFNMMKSRTSDSFSFYKRYLHKNGFFQEWPVATIFFLEPLFWYQPHLKTHRENMGGGCWNGLDVAVITQTKPILTNFHIHQIENHPGVFWSVIMILLDFSNVAHCFITAGPPETKRKDDTRGK